MEEDEYGMGTILKSIKKDWKRMLK